MAATTSTNNPDFFTRSTIRNNPRKVNKRDKRYTFNCKDYNESANNIITWCEENFGKKRRNTWGYSNSIIIYISRHDIIMAFKLRWL